jgi:hypothetical protein
MTVSSIVAETCKTACHIPHQIYIISKYSAEEWEETAEHYEQWGISLIACSLTAYSKVRY